MRKIIYLIILICFLVVLPVWAVEDDMVILQEQSTNFSEWSDFTGERYFKSKFELMEERKEKTLQLKNQFNHRFKAEHVGDFDYLSVRKSRAPLRILRDNIRRKTAEFKAKYDAKHPKKENSDGMVVDANGMPIDESQVEQQSKEGNSEQKAEIKQEHQSENANSEVNTQMSGTASVSSEQIQEQNAETAQRQIEPDDEKVMTEEQLLSEPDNDVADTKNEDTSDSQELSAESIVTEEDENEVLQDEKDALQTLVKCKVSKYLPETGEIEGVGDVKIFFPSQRVSMYADRMTYNTASGIIQLFDNVKIIYKGREIFGDYMKFDMNDESGIIQNPSMTDYVINLVAENGYMFGDTIIAENGSMKSESGEILRLTSSGFGQQNVRKILLPQEELGFLANDVHGNRYTVKVNEINIKTDGEHDRVSLKHPKVYSNRTGRKIFAVPSMTFYTNKEHDYFEANYPELGSLSEFGMYLGPGFVFEMPKGSTLKILPTINYRNRFGFGGLARFNSATNKTEFGYNTAASRHVLKGIQRLDDYLFLQYGANTYLDSWFLGQDWVGSAAELIYERGFGYDDFLYDSADLRFRHRLSAGFFKENSRDLYNDDFRGYHRMSTARFRYMMELNQTLWKLFKDEDRTHYDGWKRAKLSLVTQGSAALYGTGDTQFIARFGPRISTQYRAWAQDVGVFISAADDNTPIRTMDAYRSGRSNIYAREYLRLNKYITIGLYCSYNLTGSVYDYQSKKDKLRESTFYVALGPDDLKLSLGYDFIRENSYIGFSMAMNTKGSSIDYKKLEIKSPDRFGKSEGEESGIGDEIFTPPPSPYRTRAVVRDFEDATERVKGEPL